jgi:acyl-coenzyme A thioesterase PaaI-like protein
MTGSIRALAPRPGERLGQEAPFWQPRPGGDAVRHTRLASVPGTADDLDLLLEEISPGHAVFSTHTRVMGRDPGTLVNGGPCSTLLDFALGAAVSSVLEAGASYRILEFRMVNVGSGRPTEGVVRAVANVLHPGRRGLWAGGRVLDLNGSLLAVGSLIALVEGGHRDD